MKIALFVTSRTTIPPQTNIISATAYLTQFLADKLVERGHEVTLYAPKGSKSKANIIDLGIPPTNHDYGLHPEEWVKNMNLGMKQIFLSELYKHHNVYDIIHLQTEPAYLGMPLAHLVTTPTVITNHNIFLSQERPIFVHYQDIPIVTISKNQRSTAPKYNHIDTVYDGIPINQFKFRNQCDPEEALGFLGRLVEVKGVREAITAAEQTKKLLRISGIGTASYITSTITPHLSKLIQYVGFMEQLSTSWFNFFQIAKAFLMPIQWEEPFGLVTIEAMACGTPIIAFARGAMPEIIVDGVTGFLVNSTDADIRGNWIVKKTGMPGFIEAIERMYALSSEEYKTMRTQCRQRVERYFSIDQMVTGYENVYKKILKNS